MLSPLAIWAASRRDVQTWLVQSDHWESAFSSVKKQNCRAVNHSGFVHLGSEQARERRGDRTVTDDIDELSLQILTMANDAGLFDCVAASAPVRDESGQ